MTKIKAIINGKLYAKHGMTWIPEPTIEGNKGPSYRDSELEKKGTLPIGNGEEIDVLSLKK